MSSIQDLLERGPVTNLKAGKNHFILELIKGEEAQDHTEIKAGDIQLILKNLKHQPAEAPELEAAIADIEDQLMPVIKDLPGHRRLVSSGAPFLRIAKVAGFDAEDEVELDVDTVEELFNRLVDVAYGTPASRLDVPENREFAAAVLFLRELMHHAGFNSIIIRHN